MFYKKTNLPQIGNIMLASDGSNLTGLWLEGQKYYAPDFDENWEYNNSLEIFQESVNWLERYFRGLRPEIKELNLAPQGNLFRKTVWRLLCEIPYGEVTTYKALAEKTAKILNKPRMSAQAVGGAVGHNPISIIIPCHRVIGTNGDLTGYAGGINTKIKLLELEGSLCYTQNTVGR